MGILFSKCCEVEINFRCTLCNGRSSPEPEVPIELSNAHNEEGGKPFAVNKVLPNLMEALEKSVMPGPSRSVASVKLDSTVL